MDKQFIADQLKQVATLLALKQENPFKIRAYHAASTAIATYPGNLETLFEAHAIGTIKGIGPHIAEHINEVLITGKIRYLRELQASVPPGLLDLLTIPGLGPKKIHVLHEKLGISSIGMLEAACLKNALIGLEGFGEKTQAKILEGIAYVKKFSHYHLFDAAETAAQAVCEYLATSPVCVQAQVAGSIRRCKELIKDIDIVASSTDPAALADHLVCYRQTDTPIASGPTKTSVRLRSGINTDLRIVEPGVFASALHHFTGSKEHNTALRFYAKSRGMKMNEYGIFRGTRRVACATEEELFGTLDLAYIPPELRENQGEIEAAAADTLPRLVTAADLKGVIHVHTRYSDGTETIEALQAAARSLGLSYLGICDHSQSAYYAGGLKIDMIKKQHAQIDALNKKYPDVYILKGIESDIRPDGSLDYPDEILAQFDIVIGSVHSRFTMPAKEMMIRLKRALAHPHLTMLGHPTGRLLLAREGYPVNLIELIDCAAQHGTMIELNANPKRFDLDWRYLKYAKEKGVMVSINPDAHNAADIKKMYYGIGIARKGWLEPQNVLNCLPLPELLKQLRRRRT